MTLHDDLPITHTGQQPAVDEWQQQHPPLVTVRVWLGPNNMVMSQVEWLGSINAEDEAMLKPLDEMLMAAGGLHSTADRLLAGLAVALQYRDELLTPPTGTEGN